MYGHLELLQWARAQSPPVPWHAQTRDAAASNCHEELFVWACTQAIDPGAQG